MLEEVRVSAYKSLESISLAGSDNVKNLYVPATGLKTLDISNLSKLFNEKTTSSYIDQDFDEAMGMPGKPSDAMTLMVTFSVKNCASLTELNLGNVNIHYLDISGCKSLARLDVSGQEELFIIRGALGNTTETKPYGNKDGVCSNHTHNVLSYGVLREVVFGNKPIIKSVHLTGVCSAT